MSVHGLLTLHDEPSPTSGSRVLVHSFSGFMDSGSAAQLAVEHLLATCESRLIATFDSDELIDYRARRPKMVFERDHFLSAEYPEISLHEVSDEFGATFLLLSGPEPDYRWKAFLDEVTWLVDRFDVELTVGMIGIPWPAPHTRPVGITVHGSSPDLIEGHVSSLGTIEFPGHIPGMIEWHLGKLGRDAMGLAVHVPHYLTQFDYPRAAIALLRSLAGSTGLVIPTDGLEDSAREAEAEIERQGSENDEFEPLLRAMEAQYDSGLSGDESDLEDEDALAASGPMPDADQIAKQVERFLSELDGRGQEPS